MPCWSVVEHTKMTDLNQIEDAIKALGGLVEDIPDGLLATWDDGSRIVFRKGASDYVAEYGRSSQREQEKSADTLAEVKRKYSEIGVRKWARSQGYSAQQKGRKLTLTRY